ncbi:hypothetical protein Hanom_Chr14g01306661 [Helianthus anomalus]
MQDFETLRTKFINFKGKGLRLKFGTNIKDKTCNLLYFFSTVLFSLFRSSEFLLATKRDLLFLWSEFQILSFIILVNFRQCPLSIKLTSLLLNVLKSCTLYPLALTKLDFSVNSCYVTCT